MKKQKSLITSLIVWAITLCSLESNAMPVNQPLKSWNQPLAVELGGYVRLLSESAGYTFLVGSLDQRCSKRKVGLPNKANTLLDGLLELQAEYPGNYQIDLDVIKREVTFTCTDMTDR
ncbi:TPA: hypothetical protein ACN33X_001491 [Vibrio parahaemolyticus]